MSPDQEKMHDFLMSRVQSGNEDAAKAIIEQNFAKQEAGPLAAGEIDSAVADLTPLIKPEVVSELKAAADRMKVMAAHIPGEHPNGNEHQKADTHAAEENEPEN